MKIFIGSSNEAVNRDAVLTLARWLEELEQTPVIWNQPGLFRPGDYLLTRLLEVGREVDGAILVFSEDDKLWHQKGLVNHPRDNVLLEYGLFAGLRGPKRVIVCREGTPKNPSDLQGINFLDFTSTKKHTTRAHFISWLDSLAWENIKTWLQEARSNKNFPDGYRTIKRLAEKVPLSEEKVRSILEEHRSELRFDKLKDGDGVRLRG